MRKRNFVNIIICFDENHVPAIAALLSSLLQNKSETSHYRIHIAVRDVSLIPVAFVEEQNDEYEVLFKSYAYFDTKSENNYILLKWNTLVLKDLASLSAICLNEGEVALAPSFPGSNELFSESGEYNSTVCVTREPYRMLVENRDYKRFAVKKLSLFYNMGYEEYINHLDNLGKLSTDKRVKQWFSQKGIREAAVIVRLDSGRSPERYFDTPLSEMWLKYYKDSAIGCEPLRRVSYANSEGEIRNQSGRRIFPVFLRVTDRDIENVQILVRSLCKQATANCCFDIRVVYKDLLPSTKKVLLELADDNVSVMLFQVRDYLRNNECCFAKELAVLIFDEYQKVLILNPKMIVCDSMQWFFDYVEGQSPDVIAAVSEKSISDKNEDRVVVINTDQWLHAEVGFGLQQKIISKQAKGGFEDVLSSVCEPYVIKFPSGWAIKAKMKELSDGDLFNPCGLLEDSIVVTYGNIEDTMVYPKIESILTEVYAQKNNEIQVTCEIEEDMNRQQLESIQKINDMEATINLLRQQVDELANANVQVNAALADKSKQADRYLYELTETRKSFSYRMALLITWLPRKFRELRK